MDGQVEQVSGRAGGGRDDRPVVLLLHGILAGPVVWRQTRSLARGMARFIAPELLGHGRASRRNGRPYALESLVEDLTPIVERERPTHVVGHSMGGIVALALGRRFPGRFERIGVAGIPVFEERHGGIAHLARTRRWLRVALNHHATAHLGCRALHATSGLWAPAGPLLAPARPVDSLRAVFDHDREAHAGGLEAVVFGGHVDALAASVETPVTAIHGSRDRAAPLAAVRAVATRHGWELAVARGAGHQLPLTHPEELVRWLEGRVLGGGGR